jgi:Zn-dependent protease
MGRGPQFHLGDIPVRIDPSFFLVVGLFGLMSPTVMAFVLWVVIVTVSVLIHELGHAMAFRAYGSQASISLQGLGGVTTGRRLPPARNLVVSLAGPLAGLLVLGVPAVLLAQADILQGETGELALTYAIFINVFWSLVNLLPVLPLDGGNVVHSLLSLASGRDAERGARYLSIAVAGAGGVLGLVLQMPFVVVLAGLALVLNITALSQHRTTIRSEALEDAQHRLASGDPWGAVLAAEPVVTSGATDARAAAVEVQTWAWLLAGEAPRARLAADRQPAGIGITPAVQGSLAMASGAADQGVAMVAYAFIHQPPGPGLYYATVVAARAGLAIEVVRELLRMEAGHGVEAAQRLVHLLHLGGRYDLASEAGSLLYRDGRAPVALSAYNTACSLARGGWVDDAFGWLRVALEAGWTDHRRLLDDPDLAPVRAQPSFGSLLQPAAGVP